MRKRKYAREINGEEHMNKEEDLTRAITSKKKDRRIEKKHLMRSIILGQIVRVPYLVVI